MFANSRAVESTQMAPQTRLAEVVRKHLATDFRREPGAAGRQAFAAVAERLARSPFILDAGCGTGASTIALAQQFRDRLIVGVDKSAARLRVGQRVSTLANVVLLRCDLVDFWQLAAAAGLHCERQYLLYPNPWPKPEHLKRRWHAHPVLPSLVALGGEIELRTNWRVYAEEFAQALGIVGIRARCETFAPDTALTPFERKYAASGHELWRVTARSDRSSA